MYFTITFRSFTPQPGGLEFLPGHDYYFVSTSTGDQDGLNQRVGGRCATHNMKVIFKVCCSPSKGETVSGGSSNHKTSTVNVSIPASVSPSTRNSSIKTSENKNLDGGHYPASIPSSLHPTPPSKGMRPTSRIPPPPYHLRPYEVPIEDEMDRSSPSEKSKEQIEKSKRERAKNEELVNSAPSSHRWLNSQGAYYSIITCLLYHLLVLMSR